MSIYVNHFISISFYRNAISEEEHTETVSVPTKRPHHNPVINVIYKIDYVFQNSPTGQFFDQDVSTP